MLHSRYICTLMRLKINWDALGVFASIACAIHCAVLPLFISSLSLLGVNIIKNTAFEYGMIFLAFAVGLYSLYHGVRKHHRSFWPVLIFSIGMLFLFAKQLWHQWEIWFLVPAVTCIVTAHYQNYRLCRTHATTHEGGCAH